MLNMACKGAELSSDHLVAGIRTCGAQALQESEVPVQEKFKHYKDLWRLNLEDWSWEQLPGKGGPSARSGHRMLVHKDHIILFGGFHDGGKVTE